MAKPMNLNIKIFTLILFSFVILRNNGYAEVVIDKRPFAIESEYMMQMVDGIFDVSKGNQLVGISIINTGTEPILDVTGEISFSGSSGISVDSGSYFFGDLEPGVPTLGIFEASFSSSSPGKYDVDVSLSNPYGYSDIISRPLFVLQSQIISDDVATITVWQGTITIEFLSYYDGQDFLTFAAPTHVKMTMVPIEPFEGQYSEILFNDPWWKVAAFSVGAGATVGYIANGIAQRCGVTGEPDPGAVQVVQGGIGLAGMVMALDYKDPFRRGEENSSR